MAEKKANNKSAKMNKVKGLYALVVYSKTGKGGAKRKGARRPEGSEKCSEVLELGQIPKNHRVVGDRARITWVDSKTKKSSCHYVIIKKISDNRDALLKMCPIDAATEEIVRPRTNIYASEIISEKKENLLAKKTVKVACLSTWNEFEEAIYKDREVWEDATDADTSSTHVTVKKSFKNVQTQTMSPTSCSEFTEDSPIRSPYNKVLEESTSGSSIYEREEYVTSRAPTYELIIKDEVPESTLCDEFTDDSARPGPCNEVLEESIRGPSVDERHEYVTSRAPMHEVMIKDEVFEPRCNRFWATMKELSAIATPQNIAFLESVVISLKAALVPPQDTQSVEGQKPYEIPETYKTPGRGKVPIFDGIPFYLLSVVKSTIQAKSREYNMETGDRTKNWRLLVRQCLIEVYGRHLTQFCAKGMREGRRPAIDNDLYKGLLYWAREWYEDEIDEKDYVKLINKTAYNKRKKEVQRNKEEDAREKRARIQRNRDDEEEGQGSENENENEK